MTKSRSNALSPALLAKVFGAAFFAYLFLGFMLLPCLKIGRASCRERV